MTVSASVPLARILAWATHSRLRINVVIALLGLTLFGAVHATSGRIPVNDGVGWDGGMYAAMTTARLVDGNTATQTRPLVALVARIPYRAGLDVISAYQLTNVISAFALYLLACFVLDKYSIGPVEKLFFVANLALSIATARMFAFYPVLVDLGALAVMMLATYAILSRTGWVAGLAVLLAVTAREFAAALALLLVVRAIRVRRGIVPASISSAAAIALLFAIRWWAATTNVGDPAARLQTSASMLANLEFWQDPAFVAFFFYFLLTILGGVTALLAGRLWWCLKTLVLRPELGIFAALIIAAAAGGNADIWRYLVFLLPVVTILFAKFVREFQPHPWLLALALAFTVATQEPFGRMTVEKYFQDWFPVYVVRDSGNDVTALWAAWSQRFLLTVVLFITLTVVQWIWLRRRVQQPGPAPGLTG